MKNMSGVKKKKGKKSSGNVNTNTRPQHPPSVLFKSTSMRETNR